MKRQRKHQRGFTLLELVIVIIVIAVLAALALPQYFKTVAKARAAEAMQIIGQIRESAHRYYVEFNKQYPTTIASLDITDPNSDAQAKWTYALNGQQIVATGKPNSSVTGFTVTMADYTKSDIPVITGP